MPVEFENGRILRRLGKWAPVYMMPVEFYANSIDNNNWHQLSIKIDQTTTTIKTIGRIKNISLVTKAE